MGCVCSSYVSNAEAVEHGLMGHRYWFGHPVAHTANDDCPGGIPAGGLVSSEGVGPGIRVTMPVYRDRPLYRKFYRLRYLYGAPI